MMHIYVCTNCKKAYMISRRKQATCRGCDSRMVYCPTEFTEWVEKTVAQRSDEIERLCRQEC
jgi:DNA-directed RNA polymerase subunit RPC12/RpoP